MWHGRYADWPCFLCDIWAGNCKEIKEKPDIKNALGVEFASGWDIYNVRVDFDYDRFFKGFGSI